ncbi:PhoD-like phosphatase-domain-containing protein [Lentinula boryana]|uniref:PhoD-like phosphatase-domain-containing protein n=1 Tax=Lentinula boryana TaxID=40481 RepID=A0ABQ8QS29_9AGAR|nr:PhoD-like phosphatase-domain-containing protein [Lentinula boryana]
MYFFVLLLPFIDYLASCEASTVLLNRNLAYSSPFTGHDQAYIHQPQLAIDTKQLAKRHTAHARRQTEDATGFVDEHYSTFYGGDFSNSPTIWKGGLNFTHSVASGDPFNTSVLLWTRAVPVSPPGTTALPDQSVPACLSFKISTSPDLQGDTIDSGDAFTSYDVDWTLKVEATGLTPDTKFFFQFSDCTNSSSVSPIGTTRTFPSPDTPANEVNGGTPLTLAVFSCSQYQAGKQFLSHEACLRTEIKLITTGWFNAYGYATHNTSAEIFLHLGDYIYESLGDGASIGRQTLGRELATVHDYRQRLNQYRTDEGLLAAHQSGPWVTVCAIGCAFSPSGACFTDRKLAAVRAYHEWLPIRQVTVNDKLRIWRNFEIGKLLDLTMLDTRQYDRDITDASITTYPAKRLKTNVCFIQLYYNTECEHQRLINTLAAFPNRSLMGFEQEKWFFNTLSQSQNRGAIWRVVGQQIVFTQLNESGVFDLIVRKDAWDGYRVNRERVLNYLYENEINNTIILSGDSHANWVSDLAHPNDSTTYNPLSGQGAIGVEFAGTAVTSGSSFGTNIAPAAADVKSQEYVAANLDLQWSEGSYRGFFTLTIDPNTLNATYYAMRNITFANLDGFASANFVVKAGENKLSRPVAGGSTLAGVLKFNGTESH